jgi:hypothetical protein
MARTVSEGFLAQSQLQNLHVGTTPKALLAELAAPPAQPGQKDDYSRV